MEQSHLFLFLIQKKELKKIFKTYKAELSNAVVLEATGGMKHFS
jgi:hypothetical protein